MSFRLALLVSVAGLVFCGGRTNDYPPALAAPGPDRSPDLYSVTWLDHYFPSEVPRSSSVNAKLAFRNSSGRTWNSWVHLGYFWSKESARFPPGHGTFSAAFSRPVAPGDTVMFDRMGVVTPDEPGKYRLTFELFNHTVAWFSERGAPTLSLPVVVD